MPRLSRRGEFTEYYMSEGLMMMLKYIYNITN